MYERNVINGNDQYQQTDTGQQDAVRMFEHAADYKRDWRDRRGVRLSVFLPFIGYDIPISPVKQEHRR